MLFGKENKLKSKPYFTARNFIELKKINVKLPETAILIPCAHIDEYLKANSKNRIKILSADIDIIADNLLIASNYGMGGPITAMLQEVFIELGVKNFIIVGIAGGLADGLKIGDTVICSGALCDGGTAKDYIGEDFIAADENLVSLFKSRLEYKAAGITWTTDSIFRETVGEIAFYRRQNVQTVEMEADTVFSVCKAKSLKAAAVFVISDLLTGETWEPVLLGPGVDEKFEEILQKIVTALLAY